MFPESKLTIASKSDDPKKNWKLLKSIVDRLLNRIYHSGKECPSSLSEIFNKLCIINSKINIA